MKLEQSFDVHAPVDEVWRALIDVERVAPCLPGAEITEAADDGSYRGTFQVRLGPATAAYQGELHMESVDEDARVAVMRANGRDKRGQGSAKAAITSRVTEAEGATRIEVETDLTITGRLARFGRGGMMEDISNRLMREFAECLQRTLEQEPVEKETVAEAAERAAADAAAQGAATVPASPGGAPPIHPAAGRRTAGAQAPPAKPISGLRLFFQALWDRLRRAFRRG